MFGDTHTHTMQKTIRVWLIWIFVFFFTAPYNLQKELAVFAFSKGSRNRGQRYGTSEHGNMNEGMYKCPLKKNL